MLTRITIENVALIERAEIELHPKLNILSGETGSGKSVILDSINFVLGAKADKSMIRHMSDTCSVEAVFHLSPDFYIDEFMQDMQIEADEDLIIRRNFTRDGRGSIKVNGHTVNRTMLIKITERLVDVHGQSEHFYLLSEKNQLKLLDSIAGQDLQSKKRALHTALLAKKEIVQKLNGLGGDVEERMRRLDMLQFQIAEIEEANITIGEEEKLQAERKRNNNIEKITMALQECENLFENEHAILDSMRRAKRNLANIVHLDEKYAELQNRVESLTIEAEDIASNLQEYTEELVYDERAFATVEERLDCLQRLKRKYGDSEEKILAYYERSVQEYTLLKNSDVECERLQKEIFRLNDELYAYCEEITALRKKAAESFCQKVEAELATLNIAHAKFCTEFATYTKQDIERVTIDGLDSVYFTFSANKGEPLKPLSKVISGGEMSRLMLAIKTNMQENTQSTTYIFDEIDAGISGSTGHVVAEKFAKIAESKQILAVSHLPQIIAMGDMNFKIFKTENASGQTTTEILPLGKEEKKQEIIRLVGGVGGNLSGTNSANALAEELLKNAENYKNLIQQEKVV